MPTHPAVVHFPIVLVVLWPLVDVIGLLSKSPALSRLAVALLGAALVASLVSTVTGQLDLEVAMRQGHPEAVLATHADLAAIVPWVLIGVLALRWGGALRFGRVGRLVGLVAGFAVWPLLYAVAESGGALVYRHAVGVVVEAERPEPLELPAGIRKPEER